MRKSGFVFVCTILFVFLSLADAFAFQAKVVPSEINPGDAFIIKVTGLETSEMPSAVLGNDIFYFSRCGDGCFNAIGAVSMETEPGNIIIKLNAAKKTRDLSLVVKPVTFPKINLTLSPEKVFLSPEDLKRANHEAKKLKLILKKISDRLWDGDFILPLDNQLSTKFGVIRIINKEKISPHRGLDIKGKQGDEIKAANRGRVVLAENLFFGGNTIVLDHGQGIYTIYMHLSKFRVKLEDIVSKGDVIGLVGSSGRASGPHLHFGVKVLNINANPVSLVGLDL